MSTRDIAISAMAVLGVIAFTVFFFRSIIIGYLAGGAGSGGDGAGDGPDLGPGSGNDGSSDLPVHHDTASDASPSVGECGGEAGD